MAVNRPNRGLGIGQTWQNLTASRVLGTTYTNTTGRPIALSIKSPNVNSNTATITVDGVVMSYRWGGDSFAAIIPMFAIVHIGGTYVVNSGSAVDWFELR